MSHVVERFINAAKAKVQDQLQSLGEFPKQEPFEHGVQVGVYQGLSQALAVMDAIIRDVDEQERRS